MKNLIIKIFDILFPRRENDAVIFSISPQEFCQKIPRWRGEVYPGMSAIFHYQNPTAKAMIKEFKSSKNAHAAKIAAHALADFFEENKIHGAIIVPMPISRKRRRLRGYNQCEFLAEYFMREVEKRKNMSNFEIWADILEKPIDTAKLAFKNRSSRLKANEGVFRVRCTLLHLKKRIIIIDDVITTGSTMRSAIDIFHKAGAKDVYGIGIAH